MDINNFIHDVKEYFSWWKFLIFFVSAILFFVMRLPRFLKITYRQFRNLSRKILIISDSSEYGVEHDLLNESGLFTLTEIKGNDSRNLDKIIGEKAVVFCYSNSFSLKYVELLINRVRNQQAALLVYSHTQIPDKIANEIKKHRLFVISNSPLRLMSDLYAIMTTIK